MHLEMARAINMVVGRRRAVYDQLRSGDDLYMRLWHFRVNDIKPHAF